MTNAARPVFQHQGPATNCVIGGRKLGWSSCTAYAMAMGIDSATGGAHRPTGCKIRDLTDDTDDHGTNLRQVAEVAEAHGDVERVAAHEAAVAVGVGPEQSRGQALVDQRQAHEALEDAPVLEAQHVLAFGNDAEKRGRKDFKNVLDGQHFAACGARRDPSAAAAGKMQTDYTPFLDANGLKGAIYGIIIILIAAFRPTGLLSLPWARWFRLRA